MSKDENNQGERPGPRRSSGATRRIVVEPSLEAPPPASGRKLQDPVWDQPGLRNAPDKYQRDASNEIQEQRHKPIDARPARQSALAARDARERRGRVIVVGDTGVRKPGNGAGQVNVRKLLVIVGAMLGICLIASVALLLWANYGSKPGDKKSSKTAPPAPSPMRAAAVPTLSPSTIAPSPSPEVGPATQAVAGAVQSSEIRSLSEQLAAQISRKGGYGFGPEFVELIRVRTLEYKNPKALAGARVFRREINKSFHDEGVEPVIGYALAMSRSKFDPNLTDKGLGLWQVPAAVVRSQGYLNPAESSAKVKQSEISAQISAAYAKALLSTFDADDFMYAIACFGMSLQDAGRVQARLVSRVPDLKDRREVMNVIRAGILNSEQVDALARFFAAGIVGENPQKFGLDDSLRFSSLY